MKINIAQIREKSELMRKNIGLTSYPVGVKLYLSEEKTIPDNAVRLKGHRYCQALMRARRGEHVILDADGISCPAAAAAFGFKPLPEGLKNGKGLIGFGITKEERTGVEMFKRMTVLRQGELKELYLFPLDSAIIEPDIVIVEDRIENLMWIALGYLNARGGARIESSTAILQATCVDATVIPYKTQKMNLSYGCYGCRDATEIGHDESVMGFPFGDFEAITDHVAYLAEKAMPNSRAKNTYTQLNRKRAEEVSKSDDFLDATSQ
ncbi:MAG: DUF169 domain-containing protein [Spirochaetota bacterium]